MSESANLPGSTRVIHAIFDYVAANKRSLTVWTLLAVVAAVLLSGFHVIKKEELGLKTRFGRVVQTDIQPGLHYAVPIIERLHVRKVERIERQRISSRAENSDEAGFTILSGDTNLLEVDLVIQFKIGNLREYLYSSVDPHAVVSMLARQSLVDILGQNYIDLIFTANRSIIEGRLFDRTVERLQEKQVGVELVALNIVELAPIAETIDAFRDVSDAIAERLQIISNAEQESERMVARTRGQAEAVRKDAEAKARERVTQAGAAAAAFLALLESYRAEPSQVALTRYWQRMRTIFADATLQAVNPTGDATIDINMIDGARPFTPASALSAAPAVAAATESADTVDERPLLATLQRSRPHRFENVNADPLLFDGRFHSRRAERDHLSSANPRSLIFDSPAMFSHRHLARSGTIAEQEAKEQSVIEKAGAALAGAEQSDGKSSKEHGSKDAP